jgi:hypothetical protein
MDRAIGSHSRRYVHRLDQHIPSLGGSCPYLVLPADLFRSRCFYCPTETMAHRDLGFSMGDVTAIGRIRCADVFVCGSTCAFWRIRDLSRRGEA